MKTPLQHFSSRRLGAWQGEWEFLQRSLACEPEASQAWWWKLRLRVLEFVIARYGNDLAVEITLWSRAIARGFGIIYGL